MNGRVFVDTNVLIDARDRKDDAKRARAQDWPAALTTAGLRLGCGWFDCLLIAAARLSGCEVFLTEDMGARSGATFDTVRPVDPFHTAPSAILSSH